MLFHRKRLKRKQLNIYFRGETIFRINSTTFLGVIIDDKLKWTAHIQYIKNKLSKSIGIMYKCRNYFDKDTMRNLYFSFIYPYLTYCVEIWGNACNIHLDPIVKLQNKCIRTITYSSYLEHTQPLFDSLNILCFHKLIIQRISLIKKQKQLLMVFHKAPFWDHCYLLYMSMIFPEPRIYYSPFYLPVIPLYLLRDMSIKS